MQLVWAVLVLSVPGRGERGWRADLAALRVRPGRPNVLSRSCRSHRLPGRHFSRWSGAPLQTPALNRGVSLTEHL